MDQPASTPEAGPESGSGNPPKPPILRRGPRWRLGANVTLTDRPPEAVAGGLTGGYSCSSWGCCIQEAPYHRRTYQYQFQAKNLAAQSQVEFHVGERIGTVWIADFTLTKGAE